MKAVLLDRDGILLVDPPDKRIDTLEKVKIFPETIEALQSLASLDYDVFIITNQAGISEGVLTEVEFHAINQKMFELIKSSGVDFKKLVFCPHSAEDNCSCRKPKTGMMDQLRASYDIDASKSWIIGDRDSDIAFGKNTGLQTILVERTDNISYAHENSSSPDYEATDLLDAITHISNS